MFTKLSTWCRKWVRTSRPPKPLPNASKGIRPALEPLEDRSLPAITINFVPVGGFFNTYPAALKVLKAAAAQITNRIESDLAEIPATVRWKDSYLHPSTGRVEYISNADGPIPRNTLKVFVGGRDLGDKLAKTEHQFDGMEVGGDNKTVRNRGQDRYSTWGGAMAFNTRITNWEFEIPDLAAPPGKYDVATGKYDFYSLALHEIGHLLGFATNNQDPTTKTYGAGSYWKGPEATRVNGGKNPPILREVNGGLHWADNNKLFDRLLPVMTSGLKLGVGKRFFTRLDFAALIDVGWKLSGTAPAFKNVSAQADFDADNRADRVVWRPSDGMWWITHSSNASQLGRQWGLGPAAGKGQADGDQPVNGDFDGDGLTDFGVYRPSNGTWYVQLSRGGSLVQSWGWPRDWGGRDVPVPGDYTGDGRTELAVWRPSDQTWYVRDARTGASFSRRWGMPGDLPVVGDFDGDRRNDFTIWRPSDGSWWVLFATGATRVQPTWGVLGDIPVPADYTGDGRTDFAVFRPSNGTWWIINSSTGAATSLSLGSPGDIPQPADFDGDGRADLAVWRPSDGTWHIVQSSDGKRVGYQWGLPGDYPVANAAASYLVRHYWDLYYQR